MPMCALGRPAAGFVAGGGERGKRKKLVVTFAPLQLSRLSVGAPIPRRPAPTLYRVGGRPTPATGLPYPLCATRAARRHVLSLTTRVGARVREINPWLTTAVVPSPSPFEVPRVVGPTGADLPVPAPIAARV